MKIRSYKISVALAAAALISVCGVKYAAASSGPHNVLYFETNNATPGQNAVIEYGRKANGSIFPLGIFGTRGTGYKNVNQRLGPDDTEQEVIVSPDGTLLFAINQGSNDVSVFHILPSGTLSLVPGSPFASYGIQPASLTFVDNLLFVVNRGDGILPTAAAPTGVTGTPGATNYTAFQVMPNGSLSHVAGSTVVLADGSSPSEMVASISGSYLFGNDFFVPDASVTPPAPIFPAARSELDSLSFDAGGLLTETSENPLPSPTYDGAPFMLGLLAHPSEQIVYSGLVALGRIGVWTYDDSGALTFSGQESDPNSVGAAGGVCWITTDPKTQYLYESSVVTDQVGVLSIASDPTVPVRVENFDLGGPKALLPSGLPEPYHYTTAPFNLKVDPSGQYLYVLNNQTCTNFSVNPDCNKGTAIHILGIAGDGTLTEMPYSPVILAPQLVPDHATGLVVF